MERRRPRPIIGTAEGAAMARRGELPEIGRGSSRVAYLYQGVVYKVDLLVPADCPGETGANLREHLAAQRLAGRAWVPPTTMWGDVLAMPYYEPAGRDLADVAHEAALEGFSDGEFRAGPAGPVLIDLGAEPRIAPRGPRMAHTATSGHG